VGEAQGVRTSEPCSLTPDRRFASDTMMSMKPGSSARHDGAGSVTAMTINRAPAPDDWRRQGQEKFLGGVRLVAGAYAPVRPDWDHDHCAFCSAKFSARDGDVREGYATVDGYYWMCATCFADFRDDFEWTVVSS
jgi:hypothetical protein